MSVLFGISLLMVVGMAHTFPGHASYAGYNDGFEYDDYDSEYADYYGDYGYHPQPYHIRQPYTDMNRYQKSYPLPSYHQPEKHFVPVIIKKHKTKKSKVINVQHGFYIPGGTQMFGKFKDLFSCQKACEITPTCFAADFNPWVQKCFLHSNTTACQSQSVHPSITHITKVPCTLVETSRGLITLGTQIFRGLEQKGVKDLKTCLKQCSTAGGGIAPTPATIPTTPQLCFGIDYDFATHKCFFHTNADLCASTTDITTPETLVAKASSVNILLCPRSGTK